MSALVARLRNTVAASRKPPGVRLTPLYLIVLGPSSVAFLASACPVATVVFSASLLAFRSLTVVLSETAVDFTSAVDRKEHTSELQSPDHLVCRLLLEKKKTMLATSP